MDYNDFINKEVINKNNEVGIVLSFSKDYVYIKYQSEEKTYNPLLAFRSHYLSFTNKDYQTLIEQYIEENESNDNDIKKMKVQYLNRKKKINETYEMLKKKNKILISLFGRDFIYPPKRDFENKYKNIIDEVKYY